MIKRRQAGTQEVPDGGALDSSVKESDTAHEAADRVMEEDAKRYHLIFEQFPLGIVHVDNSGTVFDCNHKSSQVLGLAKEELIGRNMLALLEVGPEREALEGALRHGVGHFEGPFAGNENLAIRASYRRLDTSDGRMLGVIGVFEEDGNSRLGQGTGSDDTDDASTEKQLLKHREKLRALASDTCLAEQKERRRIAAEVHDHIGQNLAFVQIKLRELALVALSQDIESTLHDISDLVAITIQDTRALVMELGTPILDELGFVPAVEWLCKKAEKQHGISVDFEHDDDFKPLKADVQDLLFQAVREILFNVGKHARAKTCKVSIVAVDDHVRIAVKDDGIGFDATEIGTHVEWTGGFGLFSIQERLEPLGGRLEVDSRPGHGTAAILIAPME
jgi:PAS domain S-box-containing protein